MNGWTNFDLFFDGKSWPCEALVFNNPSIFGIRDGRVSKFFVYEDSGEEWLYAYDRGWMTTEAPKGLIDELMKKFPGRKRPQQGGFNGSRFDCGTR